MITNPLLKTQVDHSNPTAYMNSVISLLLNIFLVLAVLYFVVFFILSGYNLITSEGDAKKIEDSKKSLTNSALGLVIVFCVFAILRLIGTVFGIEGLGGLLVPLSNSASSISPTP